MAVMFVAGFASGLAGFAFALIASGMMFMLVPPLTAVPLVLAGSLFAQLLTVFASRRDIVWRRLWPFVAGGIAGTPIGTALLRVAEPRAFRLTLGLFLIGYSLVMLLRRGGNLPELGARTGMLADGVVGFTGGVLGGLAGLSGALPTAWCGLRGWTRREQRAVFQPYIVVMQVASLLCFGAAIPLSGEVVRLFCESMPAIILGIVVGLKLYRRVDETGFRRIVLGMLLLSGIALVI